MINARGPATYLGGSTLSDATVERMSAAGQMSVFMNELQWSAGNRVAEIIGAEAAMFTACCTGGLVVALAACDARGDITRILNQPQRQDGRSNVVIQRAHIVSIGGCSLLQIIAITGAKPVEVGLADVCTIDHLESADLKTCLAGLWVESGTSRRMGVLDVNEFIAVCHAHGVPVVVDAACSVQPSRFLSAGADLVVFSIHKWFGGPTAGVVAGRRDLVRAALLVGQVGIGRAMKVSKEAIVGAVEALESWHGNVNHSARHQQEREIVEGIAAGLERIPGVVHQRTSPSWESTATCFLRISLPETNLTGWDCAMWLAEHEPPVAVGCSADSPEVFTIDPWLLAPEDIEMIVQAITELATCLPSQVKRKAPGSQFAYVLDLFSRTSSEEPT